MGELNYLALRARMNPGNMPRGSRARKFPEEVSMRRRRELSLRSSLARTRALAALAVAYPDDYRALAAAARKEVDEERGPAPGDEDG